MVSNKIANEKLRNEYLNYLIEFFNETYRIKSNEIAIPVVDCNDEEKWVVLTVKVPTGANKGLEPFDGYAEAEDYEHKLTEKKIKAQKVAEQKAKKAKRDAEIRRKRAEIAEENKG